MRKLALLLLLIGCLALTGCGPNERQADLFLVPDGYVGWLHVQYGVEGAPALPEKDGYRVFKFPRSGIIRTSSPLLEGVAQDKAYYTTPKGWKELTYTEYGGKGMLWAGHTGGGGVQTTDSRGYSIHIPAPRTLNVFVGDWHQYVYNETEPPQAEEEKAIWKKLQDENLKKAKSDG